MKTICWLTEGDPMPASAVELGQQRGVRAAFTNKKRTSL